MLFIEFAIIDIFNLFINLLCLFVYYKHNNNKNNNIFHIQAK